MQISHKIREQRFALSVKIDSFPKSRRLRYVFLLPSILTKRSRVVKHVRHGETTLAVSVHDEQPGNLGMRNFNVIRLQALSREEVTEPVANTQTRPTLSTQWWATKSLLTSVNALARVIDSDSSSRGYGGQL